MASPINGVTPLRYSGAACNQQNSALDLFVSITGDCLYCRGRYLLQGVISITGDHLYYRGTTYLHFRGLSLITGDNIYYQGPSL